MAVKTYRLANSLVNNFGELIEADQTAATLATGWTVGKTATLFSSEMDIGVEQSTGTFSATSSLAKPSGLLTGASANAFRTTTPLTGEFANTNWSIVTAFRSVSTAYTGTIRTRVRIYKSVNADGSGATELTGAILVGTTSGVGSTTVDSTSTVTFSPGSIIVLNNEYLFIVVACEIVTASGSNTADALIRTGQSAGGSRFVTSNFTPNETATISSTTTPSAAESAQVSDANTVSSKTTVTSLDFTNSDAATISSNTSISTSEVTAYIDVRSANYRSTILGTPGLTNYYRLDETSGTVANDLKGTLNGTYVGPPLLNQTGLISASGDSDAGINVDALSHYITLSPSSPLSFGAATNFTFECWLKGPTPSGFDIFNEFGSGTDKIEFYSAASGSQIWEAVRCIDDSNATVANNIIGTVDISDGKIHHYVITKSGLTFTCYIDGEFSNVASASSLAQTNPTSTIELFRNVQPVSFDEVAFYNVALDAETIRRHYRAGAFVADTQPKSVTTVSSVDVGPYTDTATVSSTTSVSSSEVFTPGSGGTAYTDSNTVTSTTTPVSTDIFAAVDLVTISSTSSLTSTEAAQFVDASTLTSVTSLSAAELHEISDAATVSSKTAPSTTDLAAYVDSATTSSITSPSSSNVLAAIDSNTVTSVTSLSTVDTASYVESSTGATITTVSSADVAAFVELATIASVTSLSASELRDRLDSSTITGQSSVIYTDLFAAVDSSTISSITSLSATETFFRPGADAATCSIVTTPSSTDIGGFVDSSTIASKATVTSTELGSFIDSATLTSFTTVTYTDVAQFVDLATTASTTFIAAIESNARTFIDSATLLSTTTLQPVEGFERNDAATLNTTTSLTTTDAVVYVDSDTPTTKSSVFTTDTTDFGETASFTTTTYLAYTEQFVIAPTFVDAAIITSTTTLPVEYEYGPIVQVELIGTITQRWFGQASFGRYIIMGNRRWRSNPTINRLAGMAVKRWKI